MNIPYRICIGACVIIHYVIFSCIIGMPFAMLLEGHWVGLLVSILFCLWKGYMPIECPLSSLECYFERKVQLRPCRKFIKAWVSPENAKQNWKNLIQGNKYYTTKTVGDY